MIQALPGNTLLPVAESLNYLTTIGLEALSKPDMEVFKYKQEDPGLLRELKQVITTMLRVSSDERTSSAEALPQMESLLKVCAESLLLKTYAFQKKLRLKRFMCLFNRNFQKRTNILLVIWQIFCATYFLLVMTIFLRVHSH